MTADGQLVPLRIRLPYGTEEEFAARYGAHVSRGGIFLATRTPRPEGTAVAFEVLLSGGARLLRGEAVVVRAQTPDTTPQARAGMTLRFTRLDAASKALVERVLARRPAPARDAEPTPPAPAEAPVALELTPLPRDATPTREPSWPAPERARAPAPAGPEPTPGLPVASVPARALSPVAGTAAEPTPRIETPPGMALRRPSPSRREVARPASSAVLGLDVGTTRARVALFGDGQARLVPAGEDGEEVPAWVAYDARGRVLTGGAALEAAWGGRPGACALPRLWAVGAQSAEARALKPRVPFALGADAHGALAPVLGERVVPPVQLGQALLGALREAAAQALEATPSRAVVCVPAWATARQRAGVREAAEATGLEVLRLVNASTAAALAWGWGRGLARKRVLVLDAGGGGAEAAVVELTGDDLEVVAAGGERGPGGLELDARVAAELAEALRARGLPAPPPAALQLAAERARVALSQLEQTSLGVSPDAAVPFTRARLERLAHEVCERVVQLAQGVLEGARLAPQALDAVVLAGGLTRTPQLRQRLEQLVGPGVRLHEAPAGAAARGAALLGQALLEAEAGRPAARVSEVLALPLGVADRAGGVLRVFEQNTRLPAGKTLTLQAAAAGPLPLVLLQGVGATVQDAPLVGVLALAPERAGELVLHLALDAGGVLVLEAALPGARRQPVALAPELPAPRALAELAARSPLEPAPEPAQRGLLSGLRRLLGRD